MSATSSQPTLSYQSAARSYKLWQVILASSAGTLIEWYDFYIFGSLAVILATHFFPAGNETVALLSTLAVFATGFVVRPFGAIVFGRIGDLVGRKYTFMLTLLIMGAATFGIGVLPSYETIGLAAPILLVLLRLLQGLALGGEYGGAATYIAEHSPDERRGFFTSFIQTTATLGLFVSLGVILLTRLTLGDAAFSAWGWRIPFLLSILLVITSYYIRVRMQESPLFAHARSRGQISRNPLRESFANLQNLKLVLLALFGAAAGQGVVWYTGQFYALYFLQTTMRIELVSANIIIAAALILGTPMFIVFGRLSDTVGRKPIILAGCLLAAISYIPIYNAMQMQADPLRAANAGFLELNVQSAHSGAGVFRNTPENEARVRAALAAAALSEADPQRVKLSLRFVENAGQAALQPMILMALVFVQVLFVTMVYGPIAAFLVELFPTHIRYTSMSLPYHLGNGVFGGLVPFVGTALVAATGNIYAGLYYPIAVACLTFVIGALFVRETRHVRLWDD